MLIYILKSAACMAIFIVFYKLLMEKENMHVFKRFYLLLALGASLLIPTLVFTEYVVVEPIATSELQPSVISDYDYVGIPATLENDVLDIEPMLWILYFLGFIFFGLRFIKNLLQIIRRIRKNPKQESAPFIQVLLKENFPPHTFFKYIFLNKKKLESNEIPEEVILHEETHAKQRHSWDVLLIELLQVVFWFNPLVYLFKKSIKLNHEFLADQAVLNKEIDQITYQNTLLSYLSPDSQNKYQSKMANAINYSSIKKRFTIMKTHTSKKAILLRSTLLLPLLALILYGFSDTKTEVITTISNVEETPSGSQNDIVIRVGAKGILYDEKKLGLAEIKNEIKSLKNKGALNNKSIIFITQLAGTSVVDYLTEYCRKGGIDFKIVNGPDMTQPKKSASEKQIVEYNNLAKKYNEVPIEKRKIPLADLKVLETVYRKMSAKQKKSAQSFPECLPKNVQDGASRELMKEYNALAKKYNSMLSKRKSIQIKKKDVERLEYIYGLMSEKQKADAESFPDFPPMPKAPKAPKPAKAPKVKKGEISNIPPPPPAAPKPVEPLDHVIEMAKKGATFYYEGKKISSDSAIALLKKNKDLNIQSTGANSKKPTVKISKEPIYLDRSSTPTAIETGNIEINGDEGFYSKKDGITTYFNSKGEQIDKTGKVLNKKSENSPKFYFNNGQISSEEANRLLTSNSSIQVTSKEYKNGSYAILLTDLNSSSAQDPNGNNNPNSAIDLTEMIAKDALFFYNDKPISTKKALWLTQNNHIERVNTIRPKKGKPKVYFWDKA